MPIIEEKAALRARVLALRQSLPETVKANADAALCAAIAARTEFAQADMLFLFFPVRGEADLLPLAHLARERGIITAYPRCEGKNLQFFPVLSEKELLPDAFGVPAPKKSGSPITPTAKTLCVLPGLAADRRGARLGYGGGFYDRFLATFEGKTIFPVYDALVFDQLPTEPTDRFADVILTEKGACYLCQN